MKALWADRSEIINKVIYKKYKDLVPGIIKKYRDEILARVGNFKIFPETNNLHIVEIMETPLFENKKKCWSPNQYQKALSLRKNEHSKVDLILVELGDAIK